MKGLFFSGILSIMLVLGMTFVACDNGSSDNSGGGSSGGVGTLTITDLRAGFDNQEVVGSNINGTHQDFTSNTFQCGQIADSSAPTVDRTKRFKIESGTLKVDVLGKKSDGWGFQDGKYNVRITIENTSATLEATFTGTKGTASAKGTAIGTP